MVHDLVGEHLSVIERELTKLPKLDELEWAARQSHRGMLRMGQSVASELVAVFRYALIPLLATTNV